jgi:hypothetical protein
MRPNMKQKRLNLKQKRPNMRQKRRNMQQKRPNIRHTAPRGTECMTEGPREGERVHKQTHTHIQHMDRVYYRRTERGRKGTQTHTYTHILTHTTYVLCCLCTHRYTHTLSLTHTHSLSYTHTNAQRCCAKSESERARQKLTKPETLNRTKNLLNPNP